MFIGGMLGCGIYFLQPVSWKSEAIISIGYWQYKEQPQNLESLYLTIERIKSMNFTMSLSQALGGEYDPEDLRNSFFVKPLKDGRSLFISVDAKSAKKSEALINAIVTKLIKEHNAILNLAKSELLKQLELEEQIKQLLEKQDAQFSKNAQINAKESSVSNALYWLIKEQNLLTILVRMTSIKTSINDMKPTICIDRSVFEYKRFSSLIATCFMGAFLGLMLFFIFKKLNIEKPKN